MSGYASRGGCPAKVPAWADAEHPPRLLLGRRIGTWYVYYTWLDDDSMRLDQERNAIEEDDGSNPSPPQDHLSLLCPTGPWLGKTRGSAGGPRSGRAGQGRLESCMPGHLKPSQTHEEASATGTPFPGPLHLTHTGYKSRKRESESDRDATVRGVPPRGWARPPLYSASCAAAIHVRSFGPKDDEVRPRRRR